MRRREFIRLVGGTTVAWPLAARAQQSPIRPLIGVLSPLSVAAARHNITAFRSSLRDLGYVDGRNATLALRYGDGDLERIRILARELVALRPDVIVAGSQAGALAVHNSTRTIPIVVTTPVDPVVSGLARSLARPGGNVTGTWTFGDDALVGKRLEFLLLAVPGISRVGVLINPDDTTDAVIVPRLPNAAKALNISLNIFKIRDPATLHDMSTQIVGAGVQALFVGQGPTFNSARARIVALIAHLRLPAVYGWKEFAEVGGLMSYGPNLPDMYRQAARLTGQILKGTNPADLPIELPIRYELIVNLKAAKTLGLTISDSFLLLADEVIE